MRIPVEATDMDVVVWDCGEEIKRLRAELATRTVELARMTSERDTERRTAEDRGRSLIEMAHLSSIRTEDAATEAQPVSNTDELASIPLKAWVIEVFQHLCHSPHTPDSWKRDLDQKTTALLNAIEQGKEGER
jgi:hypothetical protein